MINEVMKKLEGEAIKKPEKKTDYRFNDFYVWDLKDREAKGWIFVQIVKYLDGWVTYRDLVSDGERRLEVEVFLRLYK